MSVFGFAGRYSSHISTSIRSTVQRHTRNFQRHSKRYESTTTTNTKSTPTRPKASSDASTTNTIPGAGWAWIEPLKTPFYAYGKMQHRSPLLTQLSSTLIIYFLGDLSAQLVAGSSKKTTTTTEDEEGQDESKKEATKDQIPYEPARGLRALVIGGIISIPNFKWFIFLGNNFNYRSHTLSIAIKILINQSIFTPCFNTYFFGMQSLLSGDSLQDAKQRVVDTVPVSFVNSWKVWPAVTAFSFTFIRLPHNRSVFAGVVAIGWQTYLSWLNLKAAEEEKRRRGSSSSDFAVGAVEGAAA